MVSAECWGTASRGSRYRRAADVCVPRHRRTGSDASPDGDEPQVIDHGTVKRRHRRLETVLRAGGRDPIPVGLASDRDEAKYTCLAIRATVEHPMEVNRESPAKDRPRSTNSCFEMLHEREFVAGGWAG